MKSIIKLVISISFFSLSMIYAYGQKSLESPYYIYPRTGEQHLDISADWALSSKDKPVASLSELQDNSWFTVAYPTSVQMAHFKAGKLGDPYKNMNAVEYEKLEQKVWYYKKEFVIPANTKGKYVLLNFDGIDYFAKLWLNGKLLGNHSGIFGGPIVDISSDITYEGKNELLVEVISANYNRPDYDNNNPGKIVKGWFLTGGLAMEPYFNLGLWRNVRIEIVPSCHIERPFLFTKKVENNRACIGFTMEILSGANSRSYQLHPWHSCTLPNPGMPKKVKDHLTVTVELLDQGRTAFSKEFSPYVIEGRCFMEEAFIVDNPKLWYPNGMGQPDFYQAQITLKVNGEPVDRIEFDFGIRTIEHVRSAGIRTNDRWANWQFVVNGKRLFVKGINWMPVDALYDLTADKYDWAIRMAKNAGFQMFRIWGSALLESKEFYDACNKYGIMVWQDFNIANFDTPEWPLEVWEAQVCQNIFRLRNQPSLAVWCGGNEFNPYSYGNTTSIGILERNIAIFDPTRLFVRTSPDAGSIHTYPDFDPVWYKKFELIPFVAETGIHSITDPKNIREVITASELNDLSGMYNNDFASKHPEFVMHFAEYNPGRVPRMLSRASHIDNMAKPSLETIAEATQVGAGEFYQIMSEGIQCNYPVTTGLLPWVYKRPWPVVAAINLVDGFGQPSAPYYFLKRTYEPTRVTLDIKRVLWASGEQFPIGVKVLNGVDQPAFTGKVDVQVLDDKFKEIWKQTATLKITAGTSVSSVELGIFKIPDQYRERVFFAVVTLYDESGKMVSRADYWPRTIKKMEDNEYYRKFSSEPVDWPALDAGPWIKPTVAKTKTSLAISDVQYISSGNNMGVVSFIVRNTGKAPSFMTHMEIEGAKRLFFATDNYFWLPAGESKEIRMEVKMREEQPVKSFQLTVKSWNAGQQVKEVKM